MNLLELNVWLFVIGKLQYVKNILIPHIKKAVI